MPTNMNERALNKFLKKFSVRCLETLFPEAASSRAPISDSDRRGRSILQRDKDPRLSERWVGRFFCLIDLSLFFVCLKIMK